MGTQQMLFLLLSVIIVGIAISVGVYAFQQQSMNMNRNAVIADMNYIASLCVAFYKTPVSQGGGGDQWTTCEDLYVWLNFKMTEDGNRLITDNGQISIAVQPNGQHLLFLGFGNEIGLDDEQAVSARLILKGPEANPSLQFIN